MSCLDEMMWVILHALSSGLWVYTTHSYLNRCKRPVANSPTDEQIAYAQAMKELDAIDAIYLGES